MSHLYPVFILSKVIVMKKQSIIFSMKNEEVMSRYQALWRDLRGRLIVTDDCHVVGHVTCLNQLRAEITCARGDLFPLVDNQRHLLLSSIPPIKAEDIFFRQLNPLSLIVCIKIQKFGVESLFCSSTANL